MPLVDGIAKGEQTSRLCSKPVPKHRSWFRTRKSWPWLQGARIALCAMGPGRAAVSLVVMQRRNRCAQPGWVRHPKAPAPGRKNPLDRIRHKRIRKPYGCPEGGLRGTGESPQQGARGSTTHTLYSSLSGIAPHTIIVAEQRGGMEIYIHSI